MEIVIADDAAFMRKIIRDMLESLGHVIVGEASNGLEVVELYRELRPDVVTMDITMPEMDGITALKRIIDIDNEATVIMISAMNQTELTKESLEAGASEFIIKPFTKDKIEGVMDGIAV